MKRTKTDINGYFTRRNYIYRTVSIGFYEHKSYYFFTNILQSEWSKNLFRLLYKSFHKGFKYTSCIQRGSTHSEKREYRKAPLFSILSYQQKKHTPSYQQSYKKKRHFVLLTSVKSWPQVIDNQYNVALILSNLTEKF